MVKRAHMPFLPIRLAWILVACVVITTGETGCSTAPPTPGLATRRNDAEIAVTNLTPHAWRIVLRSPQGADVKTVEVKPRESLALVVTGGDYVVEQTLMATGPAEATNRNFNARFEPGEKYRWSLATLLSAEEPTAP
jgi:hypothetical protein